ncbi:flagellar basal body P-ring formation chaperone FlgA [Massilia niastensis]|uniref:flagellar basal body P-ring formation chaperone FlgA n=1 Tax=Massilia niastensis TaxID=544911 RepID=UPI0003739582|nr:flagellar basal body P-ring formation chaperone FlgA [Massilia niastensis]
MEEAARNFLDRQAAASGLREPRFELSVVTSRAAPPCSVAPAIEALDTRQPARTRFVARCPDGRGWRHEFVVRARISAEVAVTAAPVAANQQLAESDLALERRDITHTPDAVAPAQAVGRSSRRSLRAGEVLRASQLAAPLVVKRGDQVLMVARHEGVEVSMAGEALDAGAHGAVVRVRNAASGQVVRMRVAGAGTVEPVDQPITR